MQFVLLSKKTFQLKNCQINSICKLKNTHWNYGYKSNLEWFKKNVKSYDIHNLIYYNSKLIGYTVLRDRTLYIKKKKLKYFYFDTLIIDKKYRSKGISNYLMKLNDHVIKQNNKISLLICKNNLIKFYKKFDWKTASKKKFFISDKKTNNNIMYINIKNIKVHKYVFSIYK